MKHLLDFIEKHKAGLKKYGLKVLYFIGFIAVYLLINNPVITELFKSIFGEFITPAVQSAPLVVMLAGGGD